MNGVFETEHQCEISPDLAIIGGVGFSLGGSDDFVKSPYGNAFISAMRVEGKNIVYISRHGESQLPPHKINYRAIISAIKMLGVKRVISINTVGSMCSLQAGCFFLPIDFVEFTRSRISTFFDDRAVHVDMSQPYCPELRKSLANSMSELKYSFSEGIYVCSEGPHLESPAQIQMMRQFGNVVGMTGYPEVVLAKEAELCYASLCIVTNLACGLVEGKALHASEIMDLMHELDNSLRQVIKGTLKKIPARRMCRCKDALKNALL